MKIQRTRLEEESLAERAFGVTQVGRGAAWFMVLGFLGLLVAVACWDALPPTGEGHAAGARRMRPAALEAAARLRQAALGNEVRGAPGPGGLWAANARMLEAIARVEDDIEQQSVLTRSLIPPVQWSLSRFLRLGNENAYAGVEGWLFYRPGIELLTGPGFLDPGRLHRIRRSGSEWQRPPQPDPVRAIVDFRDQLAARGIELVVLPVPTKATIHPDMYAPRMHPRVVPLHNVSFAEFVARLRHAGVLLFDPAPLMASALRISGEAQFLGSDSHWTPGAVVRVAEALAAYVERNTTLSAALPAVYRRTEVDVEARGDLAAMLRLPEYSTLYPKEKATVEQVLPAGDGIWRPSTDADVLVLGDSFSNIYSYDGLGWGGSAGLVEQLGFELKRPVDRIVRNDDGAYATRLALARELAKGRDRLAGKRLVIWQFAARELMFGDWKLIDLALGERRPSVFLGLNTGEECVVEGTVAAVGSVPRPGSVPYRDHIVAVQLVDLAAMKGSCVGSGATDAYVFVRSMKDNVWTSGARLRPGDSVRLHVRPWSEVAQELDFINRSEIDSEDLWLEEPLWGEIQ